MKCYSIKQPGVLRKYILPSDVEAIIPYALRKRKHIGEAYLDLELLPGFTHAMFGKNDPDIYGYGLTWLKDRQTAWSRKLAKTMFLLLYDHTRFFPDKRAGDSSDAVWLNQRYELLVTCTNNLRLRCLEDRELYGIDGNGNLKTFVS